MLDPFSADFLKNLKQQVKLKTKPSKALLNAIKDLTATNLNSKKRISQLQNQVFALKQQNSMLMLMVQSSQKDYEQRIKLKDKKIENNIQIEAKLYAENQSQKKQIEKLNQQIILIKKASISLRQSKIDIERQKLQRNDLHGEKSVTDAISRNSQGDLNAYLFSQKQKSQQDIDESDQFNEISINKDIKQIYQRSGSKSEYIRSQNNLQREDIFQQILHGQIRFDKINLQAN